jgi:STE24 endopeptidase
LRGKLGSAIARAALWTAFAVAAVQFAGLDAASAQQTYVDRRVSALPAAALLAGPPARLVDSRRQRVALPFRRYSRLLFVLWAGSQIAAFFYLWASGYAARLRDLLRRAEMPVAALNMAFGAALAYLAGLASLPSALVIYRLDVSFGLTNESTFEWLRDGFLGVSLDAFLIGAVVAFLFALVDRTRIWYVYGAIGLAALTLVMAFLEPLTVAPLFNRFAPLPPRSAAYAPLARLAQRAGSGDAPIVVANFSRRSHAIVADIAGFGPTKRIVLGDSLLANATLGEVLFLTAREFGHYSHADDFRLSLFWTFLFMVCIALGVLCADRVAFRRDDDPLTRLALVLGFMGLFALACTPLYNSYSRGLEARADAYALALTGDRVAAVRAYVRITDETLAPLCPARAVRLYFYNSPPMGTRIAKAEGRADPCP